MCDPWNTLEEIICKLLESQKKRGRRRQMVYKETIAENFPDGGEI